MVLFFILLQACVAPRLPRAQIETIRLADGPSEYSGRIELYFNGEWGTVCDDYFGQEDAEVACRQLGFGPPISYDDNSGGYGTGIIWLDNLHCTGTEASLGECAHNTWGSHNCRHHEDTSITCSAPGVATLTADGFGGCTGGPWKKIGTASNLDDALALMLADDWCSMDGSMLFYSDHSYDESWSVRCTGPWDHQNCNENNPNWQEYILNNPNHPSGKPCCKHRQEYQSNGWSDYCKRYEDRMNGFVCDADRHCKTIHGREICGDDACHECGSCENCGN